MAIQSRVRIEHLVVINRSFCKPDRLPTPLLHLSKSVKGNYSFLVKGYHATSVMSDEL